MTKTIVINPNKNLRLLNQKEIQSLKSRKGTELYELFKSCALAVLSSDETSDDPEELLRRNRNFDIDLLQKNKGIQLKLTNAPDSAFVDGVMIEGIKQNLFSVVRDILHIDSLVDNGRLPFDTKENITNSVFNILRDTRVMEPSKQPNLVVCWGGHSIPTNEYEYTKEVGYQLGLRGLDICTGCGIGAMKGPMKGASIGHLKMRQEESRFIGISEPGIIASESPNPIVNNLIIMPDIEKRLEAFVRLAHGIIIFPGGVGTAEELLYLIGLLLHPNNAEMPFPVIITGPESSEKLLRKFDSFIKATIGEEGASKYKIILDPVQVAKEMKQGINDVIAYRKETDEDFGYNWSLEIEENFQKPYPPIHEEIEKLKISKDLPKHELAANLRRLFSIIVAGNVKPEGISAVAEKGKFKINCDPDIVAELEELLNEFIEEDRMKLPSDKKYEPCYEIITKD